MTRSEGGSKDRRGAWQSHLAFDARAVGSLECDAWIAYYRRDWLRFAWAGVRLARTTFSLSWPATLACCWLVLRANQLWAPYPHNHPERAQRAMERFYRIAGRRCGADFDAGTAAELEVAWWYVHRDQHHSGLRLDWHRALAEAIARLYAHIYGLPIARVRAAAEARAEAMGHTDTWVGAGCPASSPLIDRARGALVRCYAELRAAVSDATAALESSDDDHRPEVVSSITRAPARRRSSRYGASLGNAA